MCVFFFKFHSIPFHCIDFDSQQSKYVHPYISTHFCTPNPSPSPKNHKRNEQAEHIFSTWNIPCKPSPTYDIGRGEKENMWNKEAKNNKNHTTSQTMPIRTQCGEPNKPNVGHNQDTTTWTCNGATIGRNVERKKNEIEIQLPWRMEWGDNRMGERERKKEK